MSALRWSTGERLGNHAIQFIIGIILARLLSPTEFGLVGMLAIFLVVSNLFIESGFGTALVQRQNVTYLDECSVFYFNLVASLVAAAMLSAAAPYIADFYREPILKPLTRFLSINLIINSFGIIQMRILTKAIDFKTQTKVSLYSVFFSGVIGIVCAFKGLGVWSLAIQSVCSNFIRTGLLWIYNRWRPSLTFSIKPLREMFGYSSRLLASGFLSTVMDNLYFLIIGKLFSATELGFYSRAQMFAQLPSYNLCGIVSRVTFPVFALLQNDKTRLKQGYKKSLRTLAGINFPIMFGLVAVAKPLVLVLLTEKWLPCVLYLQILCIAGMMYPLHGINLSILKALGRSDLFFRLTLIKYALMVVNISITWRWGIEMMIWGLMFLNILSYYINSYYSGSIINYGIIEQIKDISPYFAISIAMGSIVWMIQYVDFKYTLSLLLCQVVAGLIVFIFIARAFRLSIYMEGWEFIRKRLAD